MMEPTSFEIDAGSRPEAMADVPGVSGVSLTRAVVLYRDHHEVELDGGRIEDIGLGLVLGGRSSATAEAVDLASGELKSLDLSTELVVLDWVYQPTLDHVAGLLEARARSRGEDGEEDAGRALRTYAFDLARRVLSRVGFGPLTRPVLLRIGFRDVCRDLDLHEGTSVRLSLAGGGLVRARLDYDATALVFRTASRDPLPELERALEESFPDRDLRRVERVRDTAPLSYQVRLPQPLSLAETRSLMSEIRRGLEHLVARFEPRRFEAAHDVLDTLGSRETLAGLRLQEPRVRTTPLRDRSKHAADGPGDVASRTVH